MPFYIAFFCALPHTEVDYLEQTLQEYDSVTEYLIGMETSKDTHQDTSGQHFHFFTDMDSKDYHRFSIRVFRNKYKLRGQATKGKSRQYGKIKEIHELDRMAAYTLKDNNIRTNMQQNVIKKYQDISFEKRQEQDIKEHLFDFLRSQNEIDPYKIRTFIIDFFRSEGEKTKKSLSRNIINTYLTSYMMYGDPKHFTLAQIEDFIFLH